MIEYFRHLYFRDIVFDSHFPVGSDGCHSWEGALLFESDQLLSTKSSEYMALCRHSPFSLGNGIRFMGECYFLHRIPELELCSEGCLFYQLVL